jgi:hypothetical protein
MAKTTTNIIKFQPTKQAKSVDSSRCARRDRALRERGYDPSDMHSRIEGLVQIAMSNQEVLAWLDNNDPSRPRPCPDFI